MPNIANEWVFEAIQGIGEERVQVGCSTQAAIKLPIEMGKLGKRGQWRERTTERSLLRGLFLSLPFHGRHSCSPLLRATNLGSVHFLVSQGFYVLLLWDKVIPVPFELLLLATLPIVLGSNTRSCASRPPIILGSNTRSTWGVSLLNTRGSYPCVTYPYAPFLACMPYLPTHLEGCTMSYYGMLLFDMICYQNPLKARVIKRLPSTRSILMM